MKIASARLVAIYWSLFSALCVDAQETKSVELKPGEARAQQLHTEFNYDSFRSRDEAAAAIDFDNIDHDLLSAAVFHETNHRRRKHNLPALGYKPELREAARIQARGMAREEMVSHRHPKEQKKTLIDRLEHVGLRGAFTAENVAVMFGIRYESGKPVVTREQDGRMVFSYEPAGKPIAPHTYLSFAEALVDGWMGSEGHRKNILSKEAQLLGTGHVHGKNEMGMDIFYSVQVFYSELKVPAGTDLMQVP